MNYIGGYKMPPWLRITGSVLVCLMLVEGSFHTHGSGDEESSSGDHGCFLCTFMSGAENDAQNVDGELRQIVPLEQVIPVHSKVTVCQEPRTADGNRSPPAR
jgi:hypothetical protein